MRQNASPQDTRPRPHSLINMKPSLLFLSHAQALAWKENTIIHILQAIAKGEATFGFRTVFYFRLGENLTNPRLECANVTILAIDTFPHLKKNGLFPDVTYLCLK